VKEARRPVEHERTGRASKQDGIRNCSPGVDRAARTVKNIVQEIEYTVPRVLFVIAEPNLNLLNVPSLEVLAVLGVSQEIGLTHIKSR